MKRCPYNISETAMVRRQLCNSGLVGQRDRTRSDSDGIIDSTILTLMEFPPTFLSLVFSIPSLPLRVLSCLFRHFDSRKAAQRQRVLRIVGTLILAIFFLTISLASDLISSAAAQRRPRRRPVTAARPAIDYSKFSHATEKHRGQCLTCHKVPTKNWQRVGDFPDVADYPDHDACVSCHRRQFFRGARPQICTVCHLQSSPREDKRYVFRNPASSLQFAIEFPHDKHQDVIARRQTEPRFTPASGNVFLPTSLILIFRAHC